MNKRKEPVVKPADATPASGSSCRVKCVGGRCCVCNGIYKHVYHCCNDRECVCRDYLREGKVTA